MAASFPTPPATEMISSTVIVDHVGISNRLSQAPCWPVQLPASVDLRRSAMQDSTQRSTSLADRLRSLRSARAAALGRDLSQQEVADAVGMSRSYLAGCEKGLDKPGYESFVALADYYGVSLDWLAKGDQPSSADPRVREAVERLGSIDEETLNVVLRILAASPTPEKPQAPPKHAGRPRQQHGSRSAAVNHRTRR